MGEYWLRIINDNCKLVHFLNQSVDLSTNLMQVSNQKVLIRPPGELPRHSMAEKFDKFVGGRSIVCDSLPNISRNRLVVGSTPIREESVEVEGDLRLCVRRTRFLWTCSCSGSISSPSTRRTSYTGITFC